MKNTIDIGKALRGVEKAATRGANEGIMALHAQAIPLTPFRTGDLRNSLALVQANHLTGGAAKALIYSNLIYARVQHERHPNKVHPGTQMKYIETPLKSPALAEHIKNTVAGHIRSSL